MMRDYFKFVESISIKRIANERHIPKLHLLFYCQESQEIASNVKALPG